MTLSRTLAGDLYTITDADSLAVIEVPLHVVAEALIVEILQVGHA